MLRALIVKTSSLGDVIHTLPAVTDAAREIDDIQFDWIVEESFDEPFDYQVRLDHDDQNPVDLDKIIDPTTTQTELVRSHGAGNLAFDFGG